MERRRREGESERENQAASLLARSIHTTSNHPTTRPDHPPRLYPTAQSLGHCVALTRQRHPISSARLPSHARICNIDLRVCVYTGAHADSHRAGNTDRWSYWRDRRRCHRLSPSSGTDWPRSIWSTRLSSDWSGVFSDDQPGES